MPAVTSETLKRIETVLEHAGAASTLPDYWRSTVLEGTPTAAESAFLTSVLDTINSHPDYADVLRAPTRSETHNYLRDGYRASNDKKGYIERVVNPVIRAITALADGMQTLTEAFSVTDAIDERDLEPVARLFAVGSELQRTINSMILGRGGTPRALAAQLESAAQRFANEAAAIYDPKEHTFEWYIKVTNGKTVRLRRSTAKVRFEREADSSSSSEELPPPTTLGERARAVGKTALKVARWIGVIVHWVLWIPMYCGFASIPILLTWATVANNWTVQSRDLVFQNARGTRGFLNATEAGWMHSIFIGWVQNLAPEENEGLIQVSAYDVTAALFEEPKPKWRIHNPALVDFYVALKRVLTGYSADLLKKYSERTDFNDMAILAVAPYIGAALLTVIVTIGLPILRAILFDIMRRTL